MRKNVDVICHFWSHKEELGREEQVDFSTNGNEMESYTQLETIKKAIPFITASKNT
jgi:hypothetical protein